MRKLCLILIFTSLLLLQLPQRVFADGMIVPPPDYWIEETGQKAVIFHEADLETLILSVTFRGDAEDFGWLTPFPTRPEVDKSTDELFTALEELTGPTFRIQEGYGVAPLGVEEKGVTVWETKKVDIYQIAVLTSTDKDSLANWLKDNNYQYPTSQAYILEEYINNGWYFVAAKINTESLGRLVEEQLQVGHATPLKITFKTDKPFYPLKISSVMSDFQEKAVEEEEILMMPREPGFQSFMEGVDVLLYVFSEHKSYLPGFNAGYAGWLKKEKIENLAQVNGEPWLKTNKGKYLTRLERHFTLAEMNNDLWIRDAEDDEPVGEGEPKEFLLGREKKLLLILGVPLVLEVLVILVILAFKGGRKDES